MSWKSRQTFALSTNTTAFRQSSAISNCAPITTTSVMHTTTASEAVRISVQILGLILLYTSFLYKYDIIVSDESSSVRLCMSGIVFAALLSFTVLLFCGSVACYVAIRQLEQRRLLRLVDTLAADQSSSTSGSGGGLYEYWAEETATASPPRCPTYSSSVLLDSFRAHLEQHQPVVSAATLPVSRRKPGRPDCRGITTFR